MKKIKVITNNFISYFEPVLSHFGQHVVLSIYFTIILTTIYYQLNNYSVINVFIISWFFISAITIVYYAWRLLFFPLEEMNIEQFIELVSSCWLCTTIFKIFPISENEQVLFNVFFDIQKNYFLLMIIFIVLLTIIQELFLSKKRDFKLQGQGIPVGKLDDKVDILKADEDKNNPWLKKARRNMAVHEAGHTLIAYYLDFTVEEVKIDPFAFHKQRIKMFGGHMLSNNIEWAIDAMISLKHHKNYALVNYAGIAATSVLRVGDASCGGGLKDIENATKNLQTYLQYLFERKDSVYLDKKLIKSEKVVKEIEEIQARAMIHLSKQCYTHVESILYANMETLNQLSNLIEDKDSLNKKEVKEFFVNKQLFRINKQQLDAIFIRKGYVDDYEM